MRVFVIIIYLNDRIVDLIKSCYYGIKIQRNYLSSWVLWRIEHIL